MSATPPARAFHPVFTTLPGTGDAFGAALAHELRTPLNAVIGFGECIATGIAGDLDARYRTYGEHIVDAGRRLLDVVDDVLQLPLPSGAHTELRLRDAIDAARLGAELDIDPTLTLRSDEKLLLQLLRWLLPSDVSGTCIAARGLADGAVELLVTGGVTREAKSHRHALFDGLAALCGARLTQTRDANGAAAARVFFPSTTQKASRE